MASPKSFDFDVPGSGRVSALLMVPPKPIACFVMAHGAGAGMTHPFLEAVANGLAQRGIATLRFQFPYLQRGSRRPDSPAVAHATIRAAVAIATRRLPRVPLFAGGRSFGGRMTSQAQAASPLPAVRGLVVLAFPLHPAGKPSVTRADHLSALTIPLLFLQGTRDALAETRRLKTVCRKLRSPVTLALIPNADHAFHIPARTGRTDADVRTELLDTIAAWINALSSTPPTKRRA